jgi:hypothetical protein
MVWPNYETFMERVTGKKQTQKALSCGTQDWRLVQRQLWPYSSWKHMWRQSDERIPHTHHAVAKAAGGELRVPATLKNHASSTKNHS